MTDLKESPERKALAVRLLKAVLQEDERMVDVLLEDADVNPNCTFDGLPLITVAAWHSVPFSIIQKLEAHGGDANLPIQGDVVRAGLYPHDLAIDARTKTFLLDQKKRFAEHAEIIAAKPKPDHFTLTQFKDEMKFIPLGIIEPSWSDPKNHVICAEIHHDTVLNLLDNPQEIIANQERDKSVIKEISRGFDAHRIPSLN